MSQLQKETCIITGNLHVFCGQQDVSLGVEGVDLALIFFMQDQSKGILILKLPYVY